MTVCWTEARRGDVCAGLEAPHMQRRHVGHPARSEKLKAEGEKSRSKVRPLHKREARRKRCVCGIGGSPHAEAACGAPGTRREAKS